MYQELEVIFKQLCTKFVPVILEDLDIRDIKRKISMNCSPKKKMDQTKIVFGATNIYCYNSEECIEEIINIGVALYLRNIFTNENYDLCRTKFAIIHVIAHELRHIYQAITTGKKFSIKDEYDAENYAHNFIKQYKEKITNLIHDS